MGEICSNSPSNVALDSIFKILASLTYNTIYGEFRYIPYASLEFL